MTKTKSTKRALLLSALSLLMCVSMLIGSTFAWFTDSVISGNNIIKSGNLDVALDYATVVDGQVTGWNTVQNATDLFDKNALWEPGHAEVVYLRVSNVGSLALKYCLGVNVDSEVPGINVDEEEFYLSDHLVFKVKELNDATEIGSFDSRESMIESSDVKGLKSYNGEDKFLDAKGGAKDVAYVALLVYMPTSVGNEANYRGDKVPAINLSVNLYATQYTSESDAFGNDYDEEAFYANAYVTNAAELAVAIEDAEDGDIIALMEDIDLTGAATYAMRAAAAQRLTIAKGKNVTINLNGYDIIGASTNDSGNQMAIQVKGNLVIAGEGTISMVHTGANMEWSALTAAISVEGGSLTLGEGVTVVHKGGSSMAYAVDVNSTLGDTTLNINGATLSSSYIGVRLFNNHKTAKATVNLNSGVVGGIRRDIWVHNPSASAVDANGVVNIADSYNVTVTTQDASSFYGRIYDFDSAVVGTSADLSTAIKNGEKEVYLVEGDFTLPSLSDKEGITLIGTEGTVIGGESASTGFSSNFGKDTTIKNVTFSGSSNGVRWSYAKGGTSTFENCTFAGDSTYGFHIDQANGATFIFNNCTFIGFNAFASDLAKIEFNNCTFLSNGKYGHSNVWTVANFNNCTWGDNTSVSQGYSSSEKKYYGTLIFDGVEESYHHEFIGSAESLFSFAKSVNEGGDSWKDQKVALVADIDLENKAWTPIGQTGATEFKGIFDGQNYTISNLKVDSSDQTGKNYSSGLFGWVESSNKITVKNVKVDGANITGHHNVAVIAGYVEGNAIIDNCHISNATLINTHANDDACGDKTGAIAGYVAGQVAVKNCSATDCTISGGRDAGALIGASYVDISDDNCSAANVTVSATGDCTGANVNGDLVGRKLYQ